MKRTIPAWALSAAHAQDYDLARDLHRRGAMQIQWPEDKALRDWARLQGWPTPWLNFEAAFLAKMFESPVNFARVVNESGIELHIPRQECTLATEKLQRLDALYEERSSSGQPVGWGALVEELREIRRAVEAGVAVQVEGGPKLRTWQNFYSWAHGRYHMLEDGYDKWIGDDHA